MSAIPDQSTAIAVLQHQQKSAEDSLREIQRTVTEGFASVNIKMDRVNELALNMSTLQTRMEAQNDGLIRAFATIEDVKRDQRGYEIDNERWRVAYGLDIDQRFSHRDSIREKYIEHQNVLHAKVEERLNWAKGVLWTMTVVGALLLGMFWRIMQPVIDDNRQHTKDIHALELKILPQK